MSNDSSRLSEYAQAQIMKQKAEEFRKQEEEVKKAQKKYDESRKKAYKAKLYRENVDQIKMSVRYPEGEALTPTQEKQKKNHEKILARAKKDANETRNQAKADYETYTNAQSYLPVKLQKEETGNYKGMNFRNTVVQIPNEKSKGSSPTKTPTKDMKLSPVEKMVETIRHLIQKDPSVSSKDMPRMVALTKKIISLTGGTYEGGAKTALHLYNQSDHNMEKLTRTLGRYVFMARNMGIALPRLLALANQTGPFAKKHNIPQATLLALGAPLLRTGADVSMVAKATKDLIKTLGEGHFSKAFAKALKEEGLSGKKYTTLLKKDPSGALSLFMGLLNKHPNTLAGHVFDKSVPQSKGFVHVLNLMGNPKGFNAALGLLRDTYLSVGATNRAYDQKVQAYTHGGLGQYRGTNVQNAVAVIARTMGQGGRSNYGAGLGGQGAYSTAQLKRGSSYGSLVDGRIVGTPAVHHHDFGDTMTTVSEGVGVGSGIGALVGGPAGEVAGGGAGLAVSTLYIAAKLLYEYASDPTPIGIPNSASENQAVTMLANGTPRVLKTILKMSDDTLFGYIISAKNARKEAQAKIDSTKAIIGKKAETFSKIPEIYTPIQGVLNGKGSIKDAYLAIDDYKNRKPLSAGEFNKSKISRSYYIQADNHASINGITIHDDPYQLYLDERASNKKNLAPILDQFRLLIPEKQSLKLSKNAAYNLTHAKELSKAVQENIMSPIFRQPGNTKGMDPAKLEAIGKAPKKIQGQSASLMGKSKKDDFGYNDHFGSRPRIGSPGQVGMKSLNFSTSRALATSSQKADSSITVTMSPTINITAPQGQEWDIRQQVRLGLDDNIDYLMKRLKELQEREKDISFYDYP